MPRPNAAEEPYGGYDISYQSPPLQQSSRVGRYDSLPNTGSPSLGSPYPGQRRHEPAGHSIDLSGDDMHDGASVHSRTPIRFEAHPPPGLPVPPLPHQQNGGLEKPSKLTPPSLSRQSTGASWINATSAQNKPSVYGQLEGARRSDPNLLFAEGDFADNKFSRAYFSLLSRNIVFRWFCYITPVLALLWIPGIVGVTAAPDARVWSVQLLYWSIWLSVVWLGWWGSVIVSHLGPKVLNVTLGTVAPELRHYITYLVNIRRYTGIAVWSLVNWIVFNVVVNNRGPGNTSTGDGHTLHQIVQGLFGIFLASLVLLVEKVIVQIIARNFHKKSYEDRIVAQKEEIRVLVQLYLRSRDLGRSDTLDRAYNGAVDPSKILKKALKGVRKVAQTGATALGTVASEIAGERVLQPNSPASMVTSALSSNNKSRQLARRIFLSFCPVGASSLRVEDIMHCFGDPQHPETRTKAMQAFEVFDKDGNGDITLDELEMSCLEIHRERLALASSMRDVDSAVGRLDQILMSIWYIAAILIIISLLDVSFATIIAGAGTLVLGLSWLIGTTAQEILASCIFLFVKHAYDVSDRVDIDGEAYIVREMHLLSSTFRKTDGKHVQIPHSVLNTKVITNIRRSGPISEKFEWDVDFGTTFDQIEQLRDDMLAFLEQERRDFQPSMDVAIVDFSGQGKMTLSANICYKSNWQNGVLKGQRRNKWIIALKETMKKHGIFGPDGAGNPTPPPADPTVVKLLQPDAPAPAYENRASVESPVSQERVASPAHIAATLQSRGAAVEDASADVFRGKNARRPSLDVGAMPAGMRQQYQDQRQAYLASAGGAATTSAATVPTTSSSSQPATTTEMHEMQQRNA